MVKYVIGRCVPLQQGNFSGTEGKLPPFVATCSHRLYRRVTGIGNDFFTPTVSVGPEVLGLTPPIVIFLSRAHYKQRNGSWYFIIDFGLHV